MTDKAGIITASGTLALLSANGLGVLAFGDSITNGGGELMWGVALQSWALWLARGVGLPFTGYAVDGARIENVLEQQIPMFQRTSVNPHGRYEVGCLYVGVNDVRALDWDPVEFERGFREALGFVAQRCTRALAVTVPLDLGRPRATDKVADCNAAIERAAAQHRALILDLSGFKGRNLLMADHVHPTAFGQIAIAERALSVLSADGLQTRARPSQMIRYEITRYSRLRSDLTFVYRRAKVTARSLLFRVGWLRL